MVRLTRTTKHDVYLIRKGHRWIKQTSSTIDQKKIKGWNELSRQRKGKKEEAET